MTLPDLSKTIAQHRRARHITQAQLARAVNTTQPHIAAFEAGRQNLSINTFLQILDVLQLDLFLSDEKRVVK